MHSPVFEAGTSGTKAMMLPHQVGTLYVYCTLIVTKIDLFLNAKRNTYLVPLIYSTTIRCRYLILSGIETEFAVSQNTGNQQEKILKSIHKQGCVARRNK